MGTTISSIACLLTLAQVPPVDQGEWLLVPRLARGQELVYRGFYQEEAVGPGVQFSRGYRLETRVFVLDVTSKTTDLAFFTVLKVRAARPELNATPEISSVRLELAQLDIQGRATPTAGSLTLPLDGPPTVECGAFVATPPTRVGLDQTWDVGEVGRPPITWRVAGAEMVNGALCVKLAGLQQSDDWDKPRADRTAWRRQDTVWLAPRTGFAYRVERTVERREPARKQPTQRLVTRYELESSLTYPGQLLEDRRREILQAHTFAQTLAPLAPRAGEAGPKPFEALLARIAHHLEKQPPTPYREAVLQVQRRAEVGRRGETPPKPPEEVAPVSPVIALGNLAPDFVTTNFVTRESARLRNWLGKPILLVFYSPQSLTVAELLRFAQATADAHKDQLHVLGMAVTDDVAEAVKQRTELGVQFPVLSGKGLSLTYAVEATPKLIVIDAAGLVRGSYVGWGRETPATVREELKNWIKPQNTNP